MHQSATAALRILLSEDNDVFLTPQNLIEFWSVATRPTAANGLGFTTEQTATEVDRIAALFPMLTDTPEIFIHWRQLVESCRVRGRQVHDARLAAVMRTHRVTHILTFNADDFRRYPGIEVVTPQELGASASTAR